MTPEQEAQLLETVTKTGVKMDMLVSDDGSKGAVPELKGTVSKHSDQINFWRGAIALLGFLILLVGSELVIHILGGK